MTPETTVDELRAEIAELREELQRRSEADADRPTRRRMFRLAGAAAVGAAAAMAARPGTSFAAPLDTGSVTNQIAAPTGLAVLGLDRVYGLGITDNGLLSVPEDVQRSAVLGHAGGQAFRIGVSGFSTSSTAPIGVRGFGEGINSTGVSGIAIGENSVGVRAFGNGGIGVLAQGARYGVTAEGLTAALRVSSNGSEPAARNRTVDRGAIDGDAGGTLWYCTASGTPGTWQRLGGPGTAGAFTAIDPVRVYDSRLAAPTPGVLASGANRMVSVADGRDPTTGAVNAANVVPAGATAIAFNVTITETVGSGFLSIAPGNATSSPSSSINWSSAGQNLANGLIVKIHTDRTVRVFCGGGGSTHVIIDVSGFWA